jgi:hypothetical protein
VKNCVSDIVDLNAQMKIYPIPAQDFIQLELLDYSKVIKMDIKDVQGRSLSHKQDLKPGINKIELGLAAGLYFMYIEMGNEKYIRPFVVE